MEEPMEITQQELEILNFYRASELHGGLLLGHLARRTRDSRLALSLTSHSAEEIVHARLWTETILSLGAEPWPVRDTYQSYYSAAVGSALSTLEILALTQVFERRVYRHFLSHMRRPRTHPAVRATLARMVDEETGHLAWVKEWLDEQERSGADVRGSLRRFSAVDARIYATLLHQVGWRQAAA